MIERRPDNRWYAISRDYVAGTLETYQAWLKANPVRARNMQVRAVGPDTPPLEGSLYPYDQSAKYALEVSTVTGNEDNARGDGYRLASALSSAFSIRNAEPKTVYQLARVFAKQAGYQDVDRFDAFIEGFGNGFVVDTKLIPAPQTTVKGADAVIDM